MVQCEGFVETLHSYDKRETADSIKRKEDLDICQILQPMQVVLLSVHATSRRDKVVRFRVFQCCQDV